jgi:putative ABC transport system substrate-binding protein
MVVLVVVGAVGCDGQQESRVFKIGLLQLVDVLADVEDGFKAGMANLGYTEGENVTYIQRNANANMDDLERFAQEFVDEEVDLIVSITTPSSVTAMQAGKDADIPVVFIMVSDPVGAGLVDSLTQPGGQVTGIMDGDTETVGKRLEILLGLAPDIDHVLSVYTFEEALLPAEENLRKAAATLSIELVERQVHTTDEASAAFLSIEPGTVDAVFIPSDGLIVDAQDAIVELAIRDGLPTVGPGGVSDFSVASYGANFYQAGVQGASLADKILKGSEPATLPVEIAREFDLILNLQVAEQVGLTIPEDMLNLADLILD